MRRTVPPSAEIEEQIDQLLAVGVGDNPRESLSELGYGYTSFTSSALGGLGLDGRVRRSR